MGVVPLTDKRSEFYSITSTGVDDFQAVDLQGARQVMLRLSSALDLDTGLIQNNRIQGSNYLELKRTDPVLVMNSNDGYLWFVSNGAFPSTLQVWVVR